MTAVSARFLAAFGFAAVGVGAARALTTTYVPVLLDRIEDDPGLIGAVMLVNAAAGFAVPLIVGLWSDRIGAGTARGRLSFILGGALVAGAGMGLVALAPSSSYLVLGLAAGTIYVGLNAGSTAHRALVPERFEDAQRPAATSAQELSMLVGGMLGILLGGALIDVSPALLFVSAAAATVLFALPTIAISRRRLGLSDVAPPDTDETRPRLRDFADALRRPGAREVLFAQVLWVAAYAALPAFFIIYADDVLGLGPAPAAGLLAGFGLLTGAGMIAGGRAKPERVYPLLLLGVALLGGGLVSAAPATSIAAVVLPFSAAAVGAGLVTALGFPYFARFIPEGQAGRYSGLYFSVRAIGSVVALPVAGVLIEASGSYRVLMLLGGIAFAAFVPLAATVRRGAVPAAKLRRPRVGGVAAVIPCHMAGRLEGVVRATLAHVDRVVVAVDGSPAERQALDRLAEHGRVELLETKANLGKGDAVAAGARLALEHSPRPDAVIVVDADGQHPPDRIPAFVAAAAHADVVIGDRSGDRRSMPWTRRFTNATANALLLVTARRRLPDSQCGMRLYRAEALDELPLPPGRYEAETVHLKRALRAGQTTAWVPIPAIYDGEPSSFRPVRDSARVIGAIVAAREPRERRLVKPPRAFWRAWSVRLSAIVGGTVALGFLTPVYGAFDERLFLAVNSLGGGPNWLYEALDPHTRNYVLLCALALAAALVWRPRAAFGVALGVTFAALFSDLLVQAVYLVVDRPRPEEVLGSRALPVVPDRTWADIASFPSGHLVVTTAICVAAMSAVPALRAALWVYVGSIALTRITFGAHFPLDVLVGLVFGYQAGRFSMALMRASGLLPHDLASASPLAGVHDWHAPGGVPAPQRSRTT